MNLFSKIHLVFLSLFFSTALAFAQECTQWQIDQGLCETGTKQLILSLFNLLLYGVGYVTSILALIVVPFVLIFLLILKKKKAVKKTLKIWLILAAIIVADLAVAVLVNVIINLI